MSDIKTLQEEAKKLGHDITGKNMAQLKKLIESGPAEKKSEETGSGADTKNPDAGGDGGDGKENPDENGAGKDGEGDGAPDPNDNGGDGEGDKGGGDDDDADKPNPNKVDVGPVKARLKCYNVVELPSGRKQYEFEAVNPAEENASFCDNQAGASMATLALVVDDGTDAHETLELGSEVVITFEKPE